MWSPSSLPLSVLPIHVRYIADSGLLLPLAEPAPACSGTCIVLLSNMLGPRLPCRSEVLPPSIPRAHLLVALLSASYHLCLLQEAKLQAVGREGQQQAAHACQAAMWAQAEHGHCFFSPFCSVRQFIPSCISYTNPGHRCHTNGSQKPTLDKAVPY